jgi:hypothetical protein
MPRNENPAANTKLADWYFDFYRTKVDYSVIKFYIKGVAMTEEKQTAEGMPDVSLRLTALELSIKLMGVKLEQVERRMEKWDEVYYHVFPDRLAQDVKFENQLLGLIKPQKPDDKKQS